MNPADRPGLHPDGLTDAEKDTLRRHHAEVFFKPQGMDELLKALERSR